MPRPFNPSAVPSVYIAHGLMHPFGHQFTVYSDYSVFDETLNKFIPFSDLVRAR